jgi:hypothetical protein
LRVRHVAVVIAVAPPPSFALAQVSGNSKDDERKANGEPRPVGFESNAYGSLPGVKMIPAATWAVASSASPCVVVGGAGLAPWYVVCNAESVL